MPERLSPHEEKPPKWWHEAIRNNFPGSQVDENKFVTFPTQVEGVTYTIISQTADDLNTYPEGIFVDTTIPAQKAQEIGPVLVKLISPILETFRKEGELHSDIVEPKDPRLKELGLKLRTGSSLVVGVNVTNGFVVLSLIPSTPEQTQEFDTMQGFENLKKEIIDQYFTGMDMLERVKLLNQPDVPLALKKEILKREFEDIDLATAGAYSRGTINREKIEELSNDPETLKKCEWLIRKMTNFNTEEERLSIQTVLELLDDATIAAFYSFYKRYWQEKLGPIV